MKHKKKSKDDMPVEATTSSNDLVWLWITLGLVLIVAGAWGISYMMGSQSSPNVPVSANAVKVDFYVMSQCPYGTQVEDAIKPVLEQLGGNVDFNLNFIANDNGDGTFRSLHGQTEVDGNIVQLCAAKYNPDKYMGMIECQNKNAGQIPGNWEACAQGLDIGKIKACFEGQEGKDLLKASIAESNKVQATGSPTIYINGQKYAGGRTQADFLRAICNSYSADRPEACLSIPEPTKINVFTVSDKRCAECDITNLIAQLKGLFPGMVITSYDYSDEEGKKLYNDLALGALPAILFDKTVEADSNYAAVQRYLVPAGEYQSLRIGAEFNPTAEICDNGVDDTGNGAVDCADATCKDKMACRPEIAKELKVFIMSDCPYGKLAVKALKEVKDNFKNDLSLEVHYIATDNGDGTFQSLHGDYEADENIIQLCVKKNSPAVWLDYLYCRSDKAIKGVDWKTCAAETGVDVTKVEACFKGEGKDLLRADIKLAEALGISASPTWLANNRYQFGGIDAESVKTQFCKYNQGLAGCANTLTGNTAAAQPGACG